MLGVALSSVPCCFTSCWWWWWWGGVLKRRGSLGTRGLRGLVGKRREAEETRGGGVGAEACRRYPGVEERGVVRGGAQGMVGGGSWILCAWLCSSSSSRVAARCSLEERDGRPTSVGVRQYSLMEPGSEASTSGLVSPPAFHVVSPPPLDGGCSTVPSPLPNCSHPPCSSPPSPSPHCSLNYHSTPLPSGSTSTLQKHKHIHT